MMLHKGKLVIFVTSRAAGYPVTGVTDFFPGDTGEVGWTYL
jgi:hypothetical protein